MEDAAEKLPNLKPIPMSRKRKSLYSVLEATEIAFKEMPETFHCYHLVALARGLMCRPACMDGTITRRLRELREEKPQLFGYDVINTELSIYKKRKLEPAK